MKNMHCFVAPLVAFAYVSLLQPTFKCSATQEDSQPIWDESLNMQSIENRLRNEPVIDTMNLARFFKKRGKKIEFNPNHTIYLVILKSGLKAVFKEGNYRYAEVAAYKASKALGLRLVPPAVLRTVNGTEGSLQFYVEWSLDLLKTTDRHAYFRKLHPKDICDMYIFYFVFGQWDTHAGNQLISYNNRKFQLALIDNAGMMFQQQVRYGDFPFVKQGKDNKTGEILETSSFPFHEARTIQPGSYQRLHALWKPFLLAKDIRNIWNSHRPITFVIWQKELWMQMGKHKQGVRPSSVKSYYASTIEALKELNRETLHEIWSEGIAVDKVRFEELIDLTLNRRDELIEVSESSGRIINYKK